MFRITALTSPGLSDTGGEGLTGSNITLQRLLLAALAVLGLLLGVTAAQAATAGDLQVAGPQDRQDVLSVPAIPARHPATKCLRHKAHSHRSCSHYARLVALSPMTRGRDRNVLPPVQGCLAGFPTLYAQAAMDETLRLALERGAFELLRKRPRSILSHSERLRN